MKLPTPRPDGSENLEGLIARCLELYEGRGAGAVDELLASRPDSADIVRERLDLLRRMGLVGDAPRGAAPERIGDYRVVRELGRGGMGVVYEAEQDQPRRRVALKVLRNLPDETGLSRFRHEAELLGRLQHPGIASILEVGTAVVGGLTVPFFAMELVRGRTLDRYVAEEALDVAARARLLIKVADAVHHAHQKGVAHRDLKPANVVIDERGEPRVLDFGIARVIDPDLELESLRTQVGQLVGTLAYMSPEQSVGDPAEIDTRVDVYALGVVAYELFSGRLPHAVEGRPALEVLQSIRDDEPPRLGQLDPALRGDLETIVAKALAKEKERRYPSVQAFAADLRRWLDHEPITARPATLAYQVRKFARRNRVATAAAISVVLALALGLAGTLWGLEQAERERLDTERRLRVAKAARIFQSRMFARADPLEQGLRVEELLDRSAALIEEAGDGWLEEAAVCHLLGGSYAMIGASDKAEPLLVRAVELFERELGATDVETLAARTSLAEFLSSRGRFDEARPQLEELVEVAVATHGPGHDAALEAQLALAMFLQLTNAFAEEAELCTEILEAGAERWHWFSAKVSRAMARSELGDFEGSASDAREAFEWCRDLYGDAHPSTLLAKQTLGVALQRGSRVEEGGQLVEEVYHAKLELLGPEHPDTLLAMVNTAFRYDARQEYERAGELLAEAYAISSRVLTPEHPTRRLALGNLAGNMVFRGEDAEAEVLLREQLATETALLGPDEVSVLAIRGSLAMALQNLGRFEEAEEHFLEALDRTRRTMGDRHVNTFSTAYNLAELYRKVRRYEEAEPYFREAAETAAEVLDPLDYRIPWIMSTWALSSAQAGRHEQARSVLDRAQTFSDRLEDGHAARKKVDRIRRDLERLAQD